MTDEEKQKRLELIKNRFKELDGKKQYTRVEKVDAVIPFSKSDVQDEVELMAPFYEFKRDKNTDIINSDEI